jgi:hypothetical protein
MYICNNWDMLYVVVDCLQALACQQSTEAKQSIRLVSLHACIDITSLTMSIPVTLTTIPITLHKLTVTHLVTTSQHYTEPHAPPHHKPHILLTSMQSVKQ